MMGPSLRAGGTGPLVDARDVASWHGQGHTPDPADPGWNETAAAYVTAHPRPPSGVTQAQRLGLLRRLAAGPATTSELLAALRTAGWVGPADLDNRLRELRGGRRGAGVGGLALRSAGGRHWLTEPLPRLDDAQVRAIGFAKAMTAGLDSPMAAAATRALDELLPGVGTAGATAEDPLGPRGSARSPRVRLAVLERFHVALERRRPVRVTYDSRNTGLRRTLEVVPLAYMTVNGLVKAVCVEVGADGQRRGVDRQLVLERVVDVVDLPDWADPDEQARTLVRDRLVVVVPEALATVIFERDLFEASGTPQPEQVEHDTCEVHGTFPRALAWDVMEQLCAWAGSVQVREPLWLVNAVSRRLRAGLREMETAEGFTLVKPEPERRFASHAAAVAWEPHEPSGRSADGRARRISRPQ